MLIRYTYAKAEKNTIWWAITIWIWWIKIHTLTLDFVDLMHSHSFISLINRPARMTKSTATLIDNICRNCTKIKNSYQGFLATDISDDIHILSIDCDRIDCVKDDFIYRRNMSQDNKRLFGDDFPNLNWNEMYQLCDTQAAFEWFYSNVKFVTPIWQIFS